MYRVREKTSKHTEVVGNLSFHCKGNTDMEWGEDEEELCGTGFENYRCELKGKKSNSKL